MIRTAERAVEMKTKIDFSKNDRRVMEKQAGKWRARPRKCLQGASHEEVPAAVTMALPLVAMGTSMNNKNTVWPTNNEEKANKVFMVASVSNSYWYFAYNHSFYYKRVPYLRDTPFCSEE